MILCILQFLLNNIFQSIVALGALIVAIISLVKNNKTQKVNDHNRSIDKIEKYIYEIEGAVNFPRKNTTPLLLARSVDSLNKCLKGLSAVHDRYFENCKNLNNLFKDELFEKYLSTGEKTSHEEDEQIKKIQTLLNEFTELLTPPSKPHL